MILYGVTETIMLYIITTNIECEAQPYKKTDRERFSVPSAVVLTASEALCFSVPYLVGAKHLAVTANHSDKVCVCVYTLSHLGMNQREERRAM